MKLFVVLFVAVFGMAWAQTDILSNFGLNLQIPTQSDSSPEAKQNPSIFGLDLKIPTNSGSSPEEQQNPSNSGSSPEAQKDPSNIAVDVQVPTKNSSSNLGINVQVPIIPGASSQQQPTAVNPDASSQQQQFPSNTGSPSQWQQYPSNSQQQPQPQPYPSFTPTNCPPKNYYVNRKDPLSWSEAKNRCQLNGMQLATIDTRNKYNNLRMQLDALNTGDGFWAYGTSLGRGEFYWPALNQEFTYADWGPGQPDHYGGNENCLDFRKYGGQYRFNDLNCANRQGFICEYP